MNHQAVSLKQINVTLELPSLIIFLVSREAPVRDLRVGAIRSVSQRRQGLQQGILGNSLHSLIFFFKDDIRSSQPFIINTERKVKSCPSQISRA